MLMLLQIPGLPSSYLPTKGMEMVIAMHERIRASSIEALSLLILFSLLISAFAPLSGVAFTAKESVLRVALVVLLIAGYHQYFQLTLGLTHAFAQSVVISDAELEKLNEGFRKAGEQQTAGTPAAGDLPWYSRLGMAVALLNPISALISDLLMSLIVMTFFLVVGFIQWLWTSLVCVLYMFGPLVLIFGVLPGWGSRVVMGFFGATMTMGLWQIWNSVCGWMVLNADALFHSRTATDLAFNGSDIDVVNHYEAILLAFTFTVLYLAGPSFITLLFGLSKFGAYGSLSMMAAGGTVIRTGSQMLTLPIQAAMMAKGLPTGGGGGLTGGVAAGAAGGARSGWFGRRLGSGGSGGGGAPKQIAGARSIQRPSAQGGRVIDVSPLDRGAERQLGGGRSPKLLGPAKE